MVDIFSVFMSFWMRLVACLFSVIVCSYISYLAREEIRELLNTLLVFPPINKKYFNMETDIFKQVQSAVWLITYTVMIAVILLYIDLTLIIMEYLLPIALMLIALMLSALIIIDQPSRKAIFLKKMYSIPLIEIDTWLSQQRFFWLNHSVDSIRKSIKESFYLWSWIGGIIWLIIDFLVFRRFKPDDLTRLWFFWCATNRFSPINMSMISTKLIAPLWYLLLSIFNKKERLLASNLMTSAATLTLLSNSFDSVTRKSVAANPNTPSAVICSFLKDYPNEVINNPMFPLILLGEPQLLQEISTQELVEIMKCFNYLECP
jgi:hypothetical protein